jgi:DNA mismatch repair protein MutS
MTRTHNSGTESSSPEGTIAGRSVSAGSALSGGFESILFDQPGGSAEAEELREPDFFGDLNLDQVLEAMTAGRGEYDLEPFFYAPLHEVESVSYRHGVLRDLEKIDVRESIQAFARRMRQMREHLARVKRAYYARQKQAWFLDAVTIYCEAVRLLSEELARLDVVSRGLSGFRDYLAVYTASGSFGSLEAEKETSRKSLASVQYTVHIKGAQVTVSKYEGEADYSTELEETFAKFEQQVPKSYLVEYSEDPEANHIEARILELVARLYPDVFGSLDEYCARHRDYLDETIDRFDREAQFYLAYLELVDRLSEAGLPFCYPQVPAQAERVFADGAFDLALAIKLVRERLKVVCNDFYLEKPERIIVVTGPNNGGKTTFARMLGQLHYLTSLGLLVPGTGAQLILPDRVFTHFEREEDIETLRGKLDDELVRAHEILAEATGDSVIVMNETFSSTTLQDALFVGTEVMKRILALNSLGVYVTFVVELASLSEATVSMVSTVAPENPSERTFMIVRKSADGLAHAWAIAEKYGLTYERLIERVSS